MSLAKETLTQYGAHRLVARKIAGTVLEHVDFIGPIKDGETILAGGVCSVDPASGAIVSGLAAHTATSKPMPLFAKRSSNDLDVTGMKGTTQEWVMSAYVAVNGNELSTTEFDTTVTYAPGDALIAGTAALTGKITKATADVGGTVSVIGIVSAGVKKNQENISTLSFWSVFLPGKAS